MDLGIVVGGPLRNLGTLAAQAEAAGFESVWVAETARTAFVQAALAAAATARVLVGTDVAVAFPRSPAITAMAARDLAEVSGGRFVLGLGSQVKRVNEQRFGVPFEHPAARLADHVEAVRAVLDSFASGAIDHRGRFYTLSMPPFPGAGPAPGGRVPVYIAAVNERMLETAGRVADGVLGHPMTSAAWVARVVRPAILRGAAAAGRDAAEVNVTSGCILQISEDRERARLEAAAQVGSYATTRTYRPVLAMHGFEDRIDPLREALVRGDLAALAREALPMVDDLAIAGTPGEVREKVRSFEGAADRLILGGAWVGAEPARQAENHRLIVETFAPNR